MMRIVLVYVHVIEDGIEAFKAASVENARNSLQESGVARFDLIQQMEDPTRFILVEVYRSEADAAAHKQTAHYQKWRDAVAPLMAEPRSGVSYANIFPEDAGW